MWQKKYKKETRLAGLVLMGGRGLRLNGKDKAYLCYKGKYFYECVIESMNVLDSIYLSVAEEKKVNSLECRTVVDIYKNIGPIGGIHAGLRSCVEDALLVIACDMPKISASIVWKLIEAWKRTDKPVVIRGSDGKLCPTAAIYTKECLPYIEEMIADGNYSVWKLFRKITHIEIPISGTEAEQGLDNINFPEDYVLLNLKGKGA